MTTPSYFAMQPNSPLRDTVQIRTFISDLDHRARILACQIATEEETTRIYDPSHFSYPMSAKMLTARRNNLMATIDALEKMLAGSNAGDYAPQKQTA